MKSKECGPWRSIRLAMIRSLWFRDLPAFAQLVLITLSIELPLEGIDVGSLDSFAHRLTSSVHAKPEEIADALRLLKRRGRIDSDGVVLWLHGQLDDNPHISPKSPTLRKKVQTTVAQLPRSPGVERFVAAHPHWLKSVADDDDDTPADTLSDRASDRVSANLPGSEVELGSGEVASASGASGEVAETAPPALAPTEFAALNGSVLEFAMRFYAGAAPHRRARIVKQLNATLTIEGTPFGGKSNAQRVRAYSAERLEAKCRAVLSEGVRDADKAIVVLLKKLGDTSDGGAPGQSAERVAASERGREAASGDQLYKAARRWALADPAREAEINRQLNQDGVAILGRETAFDIIALREYRRNASTVIGGAS